MFIIVSLLKAEIFAAEAAPTKNPQIPKSAPPCSCGSGFSRESVLARSGHQHLE
jgi:hypothetical protein